MKLNVKIRGQRHLIDLGDISAASLTIGALKTFISEKLLIESRNIDLSLNKKDILSGDEQLVSDFGIIHGDLIHVITSDVPQDLPSPQVQKRPKLLPPLSQGSVVVNQNQLNTNQHNVNSDDSGPSFLSEDVTSETDQSSSSINNDVSVSEMEMDMPAARNSQSVMTEPLVIRESTGHEVPFLLQELYSSTDISSPNDALFLLLHVLMLELGFSLPENADIYRLPANWKRSGYYVCIYQYVLTPEVVSECSLMAVPTGQYMAVHGLSKTVGNFKTNHLQLKAEYFVRDVSQASAAAAYRSLDRLTTQFKDTIGVDLLNHLSTSAGFRETQGLLSLPCEVKIRLMCFLDAKSVCDLGQTCQQWRSIYKDNTVWRRLYMQSFEIPTDSSLSRNWYEKFKVRYEQYIEIKQGRRFLFAEDFDSPHTHPFFGIRPGNFLPPMLGGDHDLDPRFNGNLQNGGHALRITPSPFMNLTGQGRSNRGRGNLTGSPFFNGGGFL